MNIISVIITALALSMDAFAVSLSIGMSCENCSKFSNSLRAGIFFGSFQGIMPLLGYFASIKFTGFLGGYSNFIAFIILAFLGGKMIWEAIKNKDDVNVKCYSLYAFFPLAIATSIDALAVGVSFAVLNTNIYYSSLIIAVVTAVMSFSGVKLGKFISDIIGNKAELLGGIVLIAIGIKILFF